MKPRLVIALSAFFLFASALTAQTSTPQSNLARLRGDFNDDGKSNILWQRTGGSSTAASLVNGLTTYATATLIGFGSGWTVNNLAMNLHGVTECSDYRAWSGPGRGK